MLLLSRGSPPCLSPLALLLVPSSRRCCASICVSALLPGAGPAAGSPARGASLRFAPGQRLQPFLWSCLSFVDGGVASYLAFSCQPQGAF